MMRMIRTERLCWLILAWRTACASQCSPRLHCEKQAFYEHENMTYEKNVLVRNGIRPWTSCRRLCRQYLECFSFSVQWHDNTLGMCNIYSGIVGYPQLLYSTGISMYMPCPRYFDWDIYATKCYSSNVVGSGNFTTAIETCEELYPGARLPEPRNGIENERLLLRMSELGAPEIWLGMYRPSSSKDDSDIRYISDGRRIQYSSWNSDQPSNYNGQENCVVGSPEQGALVWLDVDCRMSQQFLCQI